MIPSALFALHCRLFVLQNVIGVLRKRNASGTIDVNCCKLLMLRLDARSEHVNCTPMYLPDSLRAQAAECPYAQASA